MRLVAGIDSSTQSCKVVVRDADSGSIVRTGRAVHPTGTEVEAELWWAALLSAIADAGGLEDVDCISVAAQQHGMIVLDEEGQVIRPALLWNDTRSADSAIDLVSEFGPVDLARRTGSVPVASFTSTKLRWLRDHEPANARRVAAVALPHDWLTWRLRGAPAGSRLAELVTDRSDASGTGYWDPATGKYDRQLLEAALGHDVMTPLVLGPTDLAGETAPHPGVAGGVRLAAGAGDNAAAALGLNAAPGDAILSIGTSGTIFAVTERAIKDASGTVAGFADATGRYLPLVATLNAARVLDTMSALLNVDHVGLGRLALAARPAADSVVLRPYFEGERTPNLPTAKASVSGLTMQNTTRENLARASIEGMLCGLAEGLNALRDQRVEPERVVLIGGAAQNAAVAKIAAQVFDLPVVVAHPNEYVASGAAIQARWALDGQKPDWPVGMSASVTDFHPEIARQYRSSSI